MNDYQIIALISVIVILFSVFVIGSVSAIGRRERQARRVNLNILRRQMIREQVVDGLTVRTYINDLQPDDDEVVRALYDEHRNGRHQ